MGSPDRGVARVFAARTFGVVAGVFGLLSLALSGSTCGSQHEDRQALLALAAVCIAAIFTGLGIGTRLLKGRPRRKVAKVVGSVAAAMLTGVLIAFLSLAALLSNPDCF